MKTTKSICHTAIIYAAFGLGLILLMAAAGAKQTSHILPIFAASIVAFRAAIWLHNKWLEPYHENTNN